MQKTNRREWGSDVLYAARNAILAEIAVNSGVLSLGQAIKPVMADEGVLYCPPAVIGTQLDGGYTDLSKLKRTPEGIERQDLQMAHEYNDGVEIIFTENTDLQFDADHYTGTGEVKGFVKHSGNRLKGIIDCLNQKKISYIPNAKGLTHNFDFIGVCIDRNGDGGGAPREDDQNYMNMYW